MGGGTGGEAGGPGDGGSGEGGGWGELGPSVVGGVRQGAPDRVQQGGGLRSPPFFCDVMVQIRAVNLWRGSQAVAGGGLRCGGPVVNGSHHEKPSVDESAKSTTCCVVADIEP